MVEDAALDAALRRVGPRLRQLRLERDSTLADLAAETGISVSTLSRLESGGRKPTLELLLALAKAHRVALDELVDAPETGDPRVRTPTSETTRDDLPSADPPAGRVAGVQAGPAASPQHAARPADSRRL
ncbi:MAG: helix-turn-helix transcriptional regulator [Nocardioidaceae bacterium]